MSKNTKATCECLDLSKLEPVFEQCKNIVNGALIPVLQGAQDVFGYLPLSVLEAIAERLTVPISQVYGVVTFYAQFHLQPRGKNIIRTCQGTACHVRGSGKVLDALKECTGVAPGQTTEDLKFTLETVACVGACSLAPVIMVDQDIYGRLTKDNIATIVDKYRH